MGWGQQEGTTRAEHPPGWDGEAPKGTCPPPALGTVLHGVPGVPPSWDPSCLTSPRVHSTGAGPAAGRAGGGQRKMNEGVERLMALSGK